GPMCATPTRRRCAAPHPPCRRPETARRSSPGGRARSAPAQDAPAARQGRAAASALEGIVASASSPGRHFLVSRRNLASLTGKDSLNEQTSGSSFTTGTDVQAAAKKQRTKMGLSVVVVGGGIGGLFAANALI